MVTVLRAEAAVWVIVLRQFSLVVLPRAGIPFEANFGVGFTVNDTQPAIRKWWIDFLPGQYLDNRDIEIEGAQHVQPLLVRCRRHQKVGNQDRLSRTAQSSQVFRQCRSY